MRKTQTREQLYELVWSKPRTVIARELGISDVRLGKLCRDLDVPAPPRGYWANRDSRRKRRKFEKPPLTYTVGQRIQADHDAYWASRPTFDPKTLENPLPPPPTFAETLEEVLARYAQLVDKVAIAHARQGRPHPVTQKFLAEDDRLAALGSKSSWYQPKYRSAEGKQLLDGLDRLLWFLDDLGLAPHGRGTRHITMWIGAIHGLNFDVEYLPATTAARAKASMARFGFWYGVQEYERRSAKPLVMFPQFTRTALRSIALAIIERAEKTFREGAQRTYDWKVADRRRAIAEAEASREREGQQRIAAAKALAAARTQMLDDAIAGIARSAQIRQLVTDLQNKLGPAAGPEFARWRQWALAAADALHPINRSVDEIAAWLGEFALDHPTDSASADPAS